MLPNCLDFQGFVCVLHWTGLRVEHHWTVFCSANVYSSARARQVCIGEQLGVNMSRWQWAQTHLFPVMHKSNLTAMSGLCSKSGGIQDSLTYYCPDLLPPPAHPPTNPLTHRPTIPLNPAPPHRTHPLTNLIPFPLFQPNPSTLPVYQAIAGLAPKLSTVKCLFDSED